MAVSIFFRPSLPQLLALKPFSAIPVPRLHSFISAAKMEGIEVAEQEEVKETGKKRIFVAGATGKTGRRIVDKLLSKGFGVRAGVIDLEKAKTSLPTDSDVQIVKADVTEGSEKLVEAIGDAEAVICATGFRFSWDLFAPWKEVRPSWMLSHLYANQIPCFHGILLHVDNFGTVNLVEACRKAGLNRFILISSILVNGAAMGQIFNPSYIILNVFGLTLVAKLQAEQHIRRSGINYTIVRPGGLREDPPSGNVVMEPEDTLYEGSISRDQVAEVAVEALLHPESNYKVVEIVSRPEAPKRSFEELFGSIKND
ncbi:putative dehydrogenase [Cinnamomum micranthum f. kanehirae]|uniref:Putative dehydrogenase n=1 Tax=Cinnamomum micranthum f. kanehirae TaxID=337451 RepID=A0A3S4PXP4_9MAGN|nr:putative dehydrogenase [Cinnamomum micranthum f. kanehirae]